MFHLALRHCVAALKMTVCPDLIDGAQNNPGDARAIILSGALGPAFSAQSTRGLCNIGEWVLTNPDKNYKPLI